jgi:isoleucyl-tRNA synthetase
MSKHLGNILEPIPLMDQHGADAVRWYMVAAGSPWSARRVGHKVLDEIASKVIRTYWSVASFQSLYARANEWTPGAADGTPTVLDRWVQGQSRRLVAEVTDALTDFDTARAGRALAGYIDELSNWYVRRSRRRFWEGDPAALATLHDALSVLTRLLAPFIPFVTDRVWGALFAEHTGVDSVHLASWPADLPAAGDDELGEQMALVRRLVELGRAARAESSVKTRQPLRRALVSAPGWGELPEDLRREVADELNVGELARLADTGDVIDVTVKPNFRALGALLGPKTQDGAQAIGTLPPAQVAARLAAGRPVVISVGGTPVELDADHLIVSEAPLSGWAVKNSASETIALDLELTHELRLAGLARDVVRLVQEARKNAGLEVTDRIVLWWRVGGSPEPAEAIRTHAAQIAGEVLATEMTEGAPADGTVVHEVIDDELGLHVWLRRAG